MPRIKIYLTKPEKGCYNEIVTQEKNFNVQGETAVKSTGMVRRVDELGRIVLPIELRKTFNIVEKDALEIYTEGNTIILKKYEPACIFCGCDRRLVCHAGKNVCRDCVRKMNEL